MSRLSTLAGVLWSPSIRSAAVYAFTGIGFAGGNLLLAYRLPRLDYALLTLVVSLLGLAVPLAPLGLDGVINRKLLHPSVKMLRYTLLVSVFTAVLSGLVGGVVYAIDPGTIFLIMIGVVAGGATIVASAFYQRYHRFSRALLLAQSSNLFFISASILVFFNVSNAVIFPVVFIVVGFVITAILSWYQLLAVREHDEPQVGNIWWDAFHYMGVNGGGLALLHLERLMTPMVLSMGDLATFGVLAALVIAPYRTLQMGVAFSVLPRLGRLDTRAARRRFILKEIIGLTLVIAAGSVLLYLLAPPVLFFLFEGKYDFPIELIVAAIVTGAIRVLAGLAKGIATAVCTTPQLAVLSGLIWMSVAIAIIGGIIGARWGITGLLYGVAVGSSARIAVSVYASWPHIRP